MIKDKQRKFPFRRQTALLLTGALLAGLLSLGTGVKGRAAEQSALRNPHILKTTQEVAPGSAGKKELKNPTTENGITTWDCIWFGNYWKEDTNGDGKADKKDDKTPIKWRVLSVEGDDVFLLADKNLDCQKYNDTDTEVTWETCTMRSWLNGYGAEANKDGKDYSDNNFLNTAFSVEEQSAIKTTNVVNNDNPENGTEGGNDTMDKVYLLSIDEVRKTEYGFTSSGDHTNTREAVNTAYTAGGGETGNEYMNNAGKADDWWLRSPGDNSSIASNVGLDGYVYTYGGDVDYDSSAARPALHLNLSSDSGWSYAGTVLSDEVAEWDCIWFGNYWQEDTNWDGKADKNDEKTPIKWRVLSVEGDDVFLLADKNLDCQSYNDTNTAVTWETCTMRSWLNGYGAEENKDGKDYSDNNFLDNAFSEVEQSAIKTTDVVNNDNPVYGTEGGTDTSDKVYLLSIDVVRKTEYGFASSGDYTNTRGAVNTAYTERRRKVIGDARSTNGWWLRSPGHYSNSASDVRYDGYVYTYGHDVDNDYNAVRPALHLNLSSLSGWSYAGTVASDGTVTEPAPAPTMMPSPTAVPTATPPIRTFMPRPTVAPTATPATAPPNPPFQKSLANPRVSSDGITTWDCVYFGHYRQSDTNKDGIIDERDKEEPIKWRILSLEGDDVFVISDKSLDAQEYDDSEDDNITWETCTLRSWLNSTFYEKAFSDEEQSAINTTLVENKNNPKYGTSGGENTQDNIFLLSLEEVTNAAFGFSPDVQNSSGTRIAKDTDYTKAHVMYAGEEELGGFWWLRTPGYSSENAIDVSYDGSADLHGGLVWKVPNAVRPALHLNLKVSPDTISDLCWSYAGTVSSDGTENKVAAPSPAPVVTSAPVVSPDPTQQPVSTQEPQVTEEPEETGEPGPTVSPDPTQQPQPTSIPQPTQPSTQVTAPLDPIHTIPPAVIKADDSEKDDDSEEDDLEEESVPEKGKLSKGDYFMTGAFGYKITKIKKKKGEIAVVCVRSKDSKSYVIPDKVKKQGITFTVTSIQNNAFNGCKKAKSLNIKAAGIKRIEKKALNGLNKKIRIKVPKKKLWVYRKKLRKCGYWMVR